MPARRPCPAPPVAPAGYRSEPRLREADREVQRQRASKFKYQPLHALTIECRDEADQQDLFRQLADSLQGRRIRVVVA